MSDPPTGMRRVDAVAEQLRRQRSSRPHPLLWVALALSVALLAAALVALFRSMRPVMDVGGSCGAGGPFEIARPCPDGMVELTIASSLGAVLAIGACIWFGMKVGEGVGWIVVAFWPLGFLLLGWNFFEYGLGLDAAGDGLVWGWLLCGALFVVMAAPAVWSLPRLVRAVAPRLRVPVLGVYAGATAVGAVAGWLLAGAAI